MEIQIVSGSYDKIYTAETQWQKEGFMLVSKTNEKDLLIGEYMKTSYRGDVNSFDGPQQWTIKRRLA